MYIYIYIHTKISYIYKNTVCTIESALHWIPVCQMCESERKALGWEDFLLESYFSACMTMSLENTVILLTALAEMQTRSVQKQNVTRLKSPIMPS